MKNLFNSKKGQESYNYIGIIIALFVSALITLICYLILSSMISAWASTSYWDANMERAGNGFLFGLQLIDYIMVVFVIALIIGIAVTSYKVASAPVFFILTLFMSAFYGFIAYIFSYIFQEFASNSVFSTIIIFFPRIVMICSNMHWIMLINIIIGSIAFYGKKEKGQYQ
jgi:hypothetical protein